MEKILEKSRKEFLKESKKKKSDGMIPHNISGGMPEGSPEGISPAIHKLANFSTRVNHTFQFQSRYLRKPSKNSPSSNREQQGHKTSEVLDSLPYQLWHAVPFLEFLNKHLLRLLQEFLLWFLKGSIWDSSRNPFKDSLRDFSSRICLRTLSLETSRNPSWVY